MQTECSTLLDQPCALALVPTDGLGPYLDQSQSQAAEMVGCGYCKQCASQANPCAPCSAGSNPSAVCSTCARAGLACTVCGAWVGPHATDAACSMGDQSQSGPLTSSVTLVQPTGTDKLDIPTLDHAICSRLTYSCNNGA